MSYGVKYQCVWRSPMRERREYIIDILQRNYAGEVGELHPTGDAVVITQGQMDANELDTIKASEATLSLLCIEDGDPYMSLFTTDALEYKLRIRRVIHELSKERIVPEWEGYLSAGTYAQDYRNPPYHVTLRAVDGLALLKDMPYVDGDSNRYSGIRPLGEIVQDLLSRISDMPIAYSRGDVICEPEQEVSSMTSLAIDSQALYSALATNNNTTPTCYEVLNAILSTLQLQLFQGYGKWHIRSIVSLISPMALRDEDPEVNNGGEVMPIYSDADDDTGVSVAATLSLCAPYSKLKVSRPELEAEKNNYDYQQALHPTSWVGCFGATKLTTAYWEDRLRMYVSIAQKEKTADIGAAYLPNVVVSKSPTTSLSMSFDIYNLTRRNKSVRVGLIAYLASDNIYDGVFKPSSKYLQMLIPTWFWDVTNKKWVRNGNGIYSWGGLSNYPSYPLDNMWSTIQLEAAKHSIRLGVPTPESYAVKQELNIIADNLDIATTADIKIAMLIVGVADDNDEQGRIPMLELRNPSMTFASTTSVAEDIAFSSGEVAGYGIEDITYQQHFADAWVIPTPGSVYQAPLLKASGDVVRGLITPTQRPLLADNALASMRTLRGSVARQLDGEVYVKSSLDLNARWCDREHRQYYTNYIRRHLRRGVCTVQLREIPRKVDYIYVPLDTLSSPIGLDTAAYFLMDNGLDIVRVDLMTGKDSVIQQTSHDRGWLTMNEGQCCVSVISDDVYDDGTIGYSLRAYDTNGKVLSTIDDVSELWQAYGYTLSTTDANTFARSARYDANVQIWVLVSSVSKTTMVMLVNNLGELVAIDRSRVNSRTSCTGFILMPNGFIYRAAPSNVYNWWHSNSKHLDAVVEEMTTSVDQVLAVNELFIAFVDDEQIKVCRRTDLELGFDDVPLVAYDKSVHEWVAMNNALVVVRDVTTSTIHVYDVRTGRSVEFSSPKESAVLLAGDMIYYVQRVGQSSRITGQQILLGDGVGYAAYITSDGNNYVTADGELYLVTK